MTPGNRVDIIFASAVIYKDFIQHFLNGLPLCLNKSVLFCLLLRSIAFVELPVTALRF